MKKDSWLKVVGISLLTMIILLSWSWAEKKPKLIKLNPAKLGKQIKVTDNKIQQTNYNPQQARYSRTKDGKMLLNETFDGAVFPPSGWTLGGNANWDQSNATADHTSGTGKFARYNCYNITSGNEGYLITPTLTSDATNNTLTFWVNYYLVSGTWGNTAELYLDVSTDGGNNWTNGTTNIIDGQDGAGWFQYSLDLSTYIGQSLNVRFRAISDYGSYDIAIDDVTGVPLPDTYPPAISYNKILSVYNNNPIPITATVDDPSGIQSVNLKYGTNPASLTTIPMTLVKGTYTANIPGQNFGTKMYFKISATDNAATPNTGETVLDSFMVENSVELAYDDGEMDDNYWFGANTIFGPVVKFDVSDNTLIDYLKVYTASSGSHQVTVVIYDDISKSNLIYSNTAVISSGWNTIPVKYIVPTAKPIYAGVIGDGNMGFGCDTDSDAGTGYFYYADGNIYPNSSGGISGNWMVRLGVENYYTNNVKVKDLYYPATIYPGDNVDISVSIINNGSTAQSNLPVSLTLTAKDGKVIYTKTTYTTGILQPLASQLVTFDWTAIAGTPITATATVSLAADEFQADNTMQSQFDVANPTIGTPLTESFDGTFLPDGWTKIVHSGNDITQSSTAHTGNYSARFSSYASSSDYNQYLITPKLKITAKGTHDISFWLMTSPSENADFHVEVTTDPTADPATFTSVWDTTGFNSTVWIQKTVDLSAYIGQEIYVVFHYWANYQYYTYLDDITGPILVSSMLTNELSITGTNRPNTGMAYTTNTDIPVAVNLVNNGTANQSNVNVVCELTRISNVKGEDDGNKANYTFTSTAADINSTSSAVFNLNLNVPESGVYQAVIYHNMQNDENTANDTIRFKTVIYQVQNDNGVYLTLFGESFEEQAFPQGWTYNEAFSELATDDPHLGDKHVYSTSDGSFLITPKITLPTGKLYRLTFYYKTIGNKKLAVKASTTTKALSDFNIDLLPETNLSSADYYEMKVDLKNGANYMTGDLYIGFFIGDGTGAILLDDIIIKEIIPNDMGANDILPPSNVLALAAGMPLQFTGVVENLGTDNLSNKTLHLYITSSAKDTLADLTKIIDISSGQVVNALFPEYTFASEGTYHLILTTPDDMNNGNNTVEKDFTIRKAGTLLYEDFETPGPIFTSDGYTVHTPPTGWVTNYVDVGLSNDFPMWITSTSNGHSGNNSAAQFVHGATAYLVTPNINIPASSEYRMTFWYFDDSPKSNLVYSKSKDLNSSTYMNVKISTHPTQDNFDAFTEVAGKVVEVNGNWKKLVVDLTPWAGQWIYIAIASDYSSAQWYVDDVIIDPAVEKDLGITELTFSADPQYHTSTNIEVKVHNFGTVAQTATVNYVSNDGKGTGTTTITVNPHSTGTASMPWIPLSNPGDVVNIKTYLQLAGDMEVCNDTLNTSVKIKPAGNIVTVLNETFDPGWDANWTVEQDDPSVGGFTWVDNNPGNRTINPPVSAPFVITDDDKAGSGNNASGNLISPVVDCSNLNKVYLSYDHYFRKYGASKGIVYVKSSLTKGDWTQVKEYTGTSTNNAETEEIDITQYAAHQSDVQVKFRYDDAGTWAYYWALDNVKIFQREIPSDLALTTIKQPAGDFVGRNQPITISAMLYNVGTTDQKTIKSNIPVAFMITSRTDTVFTDTMIVNSLASGDSIEVVTSNAWTVPDTLNGTYTINAKIIYDLDQNPDNNNIAKDVETKYYKEIEVVEISEPTKILNNSDYIVKAKIKNNGIYVLPANSTINLDITTAKGTEFTATATLSSDLGYNDEEEIAFPTWTTNPHIGLTYDITVSVALSDDEVSTNNSKTVSLTSEKSSLIYDDINFYWIDADGNNGGTPVTFSKDIDDKLSDEIRPTLGEFTFYGTPYSALKVSSNGWITFDVSTTNSTAGNTHIPSTGQPNTLIAPYWDDLRIYDADGGGIYYKEVGNKLVIEWYKIARYSHAGTLNTFEVILDYSDMSITFSYKEMNPCGNDTYTIGIENEDGTDGLEYAYYSSNHDNSELQNTSVKFYLNDPACLAPGDLVLHNTGYGTSATVNWTKNVEEDLQGYYIYYKTATKSSVNYKYVNKDVELPYTLEGLTENETYEIWLTAYDGVSESVESEHKTVLVEMVPPSQPIPTLSSTEPADPDQGHTATISWDKSPDDGSKTAVVSYRIYRSLTAKGDYSLIGTVEATGAASYTYTDNTLEPLVTYYYKVTAYNGYNDSENNPTTSIMVHDEIAPAKPSNIAVTDYPDDQGGKLIISWTLSSDDAAVKNGRSITGKGGANDVTKYEIYRSDASGSFSDTPYATVNAGVNQFVDENATVTNTYYYTIKAKDSENLSDASDEAFGASVDNIAPSKPTNLMVKDHPFDDGSAIDLTWTASADDPIYAKTKSISAKSGAGDVTGYYIYRSKGNADNFEKIADITVGNSATYTYTDNLMTSDATFDSTDIGVTEYYYYVKAHDTNLENPSLASNQNSAIPRNNLLAPLPPTNLTATDRPNDQGGAIKLHWTLSVDDNNTAYGIVSEYRIYRKDLTTKDAEYEMIATVNRQTNIYWDTDNSLVIGNTYAYKVTSAKQVEEQIFESDLEVSNEAIAENIDNIAPASPRSLLVNDKPNDNGGVIVLNWILSKDDPTLNKTKALNTKAVDSGAGDVVCYRVFRRDNFYGSYDQIAELTAGTSSYNDTTVENGHTYYYKVKAYDKMNASNYSNAAFGRATDNIAPQAPTELTAEYAKEENTVSLSWTKSADDGTGYNDVCKYYLYRSISRYGNYTLIATLDAGTDSYTDINEIETTVYYKLRAYDGTNYSDYSNIASPISPEPGDDIAPMAPTAFTATDSVNKVVLSWILSEDDPFNYFSKGGYNDVLYYIIHKTDENGATTDFTVPRGINKYTDNNVVIGKTYTYCIKAYDGTNYSENNPTISVTVIGATPEPPTHVRALIVGHIAVIRWSLSADDNGNIAKYNVYLAEQGTDFDSNPTASVDAGITQWVSSELTAGTYHAGVQSVDIHGNVSEIVETTFVIYGDKLITSASPNPFNPTTTISYTIPARAFVKLTIYNANGQVINVLENGEKDAGNYQVKWTGKDSKGNNVASGLYFYKLQVNNSKIINKLLLMK